MRTTLPILCIAALLLAACSKDIREYTIRDMRGPDSTMIKERINKELTLQEGMAIAGAAMRYGFKRDTSYLDMKLGAIIDEQMKINKERQ